MLSCHERDKLSGTLPLLDQTQCSVAMDKDDSGNDIFVEGRLCIFDKADGTCRILLFKETNALAAAFTIDEFLQLIKVNKVYTGLGHIPMQILTKLNPIGESGELETINEPFNWNRLGWTMYSMVVLGFLFSMFTYQEFSDLYTIVPLAVIGGMLVGPLMYTENVRCTAQEHRERLNIQDILTLVRYRRIEMLYSPSDELDTVHRCLLTKIDFEGEGLVTLKIVRRRKSELESTDTMIEISIDVFNDAVRNNKIRLCVGELKIAS